MNLLCKTVAIACLLALSSRSVVGQRCNGGVECISLNDCTGLLSQLQNGATPQLTRLLRGLHCGFQGEQPMFINTGLSGVRKSSRRQQAFRWPMSRKNRKRKFISHSKQPKYPATTKTVTRPNQRPIMRPTVRPTIRPTVRPTVKPTMRPTVRPIIRQTLRPIMRKTTTPTLKPPVRPMQPEKHKICCPPEFQGQNFYPVPTPTNSDTRNGGAGNKGGWSGGGSSNSNGNRWNGGGGGLQSDPSSLLPDRRVCGIQSNERIVGGTRADLDEHPWMALLRYDKPYGWGFYCGGVLISERYVLTAAHCVKGQDLPTNWKLSQVRLGEWNTSSTRDCVMDDCADPVQDIVVEERIAHELYDPNDGNQHNDIALLRLAQPVHMSDFVKPICLPLTRDLKNNGFDGYMMQVAGWGKTESRSESDVKLKVYVPVVSKSECAQVFNRVSREIVDTQLCAGGRAGQDSCRGDSGGALMGRMPSADNWFAIGVVSYGPSPCGTPGWPGVYTRVGAYTDWILSKIRP